MSKIKVEIWSDVVCPFCYIGKRRFEHALEKFPNRNEVEIEWRSFQLDPEVKPVPGMSINEYLARRKGVSVAEGKQMNDYMANMAKEVGLHYDFDKAVVANSFDAHRLIQLAKDHGKGDKMEERLFKAYFTEGKNTADHSVLIQLGTEIGLDPATIKKVLDSSEYADKVEQDIYEAQQIGVRGVPYFVLNDRYAVSGAQGTETFLGVLNKAWEEWEKERPALKDISSDNAAVCTTDGECK